MIQQQNPSGQRSQAIHSTPREQRPPSTTSSQLPNAGADHGSVPTTVPLSANPSLTSHVASVDIDIFRGFTDSQQQNSQALAATQSQGSLLTHAQTRHESFSSQNNTGSFQNQVTTSPLLRPSSATMSHSPLEEASDQSHGTLVISHTGRSKYLGPTAASEWLKDVSALSTSDIDRALIRSKRLTLCMTHRQRPVQAPPARHSLAEQCNKLSTGPSHSWGPVTLRPSHPSCSRFPIRRRPRCSLTHTTATSAGRE